MLSHYLSGEPTRRRGSPIKYMSGDIYRCKGEGPDDYAYMLAPNPDMWDGVLKTIDRTDLIGDAEWSNGAWRARNWDQVHELIEPWTLEHDKWTVAERFQANGVPCSAVFDTGDLLASEHLRERGAVVTIEHPDMGTFDVPGNPVRLADSPTDVRRAPQLGEHTTDLLEELAGIDPDEIDGLRSRGVV
jgi:formyl-CoA transferase